jgi:hypothetical protein
MLYFLRHFKLDSTLEDITVSDIMAELYFGKTLMNA